MFEAIRRWMQRDATPPLHLVVEGTIVESGTHEPLTHLGPTTAPTEAWFALDITHAQLSDGSPQQPERLQPREFTGPLDLREQFSVGDRVRVTTTTATGRQIHQMTALESTD